jgi:arylsulfatase A-like enzyme
MNASVSRRNFLTGTVSMLAAAGLAQGRDTAQRRPNILWITSEDNGPQLGAYGDRFAVTPQLDRLAQRGMIYLNAWSNAPVCAPARTAIITGMYPTSTGSEHMRSLIRLPAGIRMFPQLLREAGYYCTNNSKEDYNLEKPGQVWDESSSSAHWRNRNPEQPFFAVFNFTETHESQIRKRPHTPVHDASKIPIPAYHPDHPDVRRDWAQYYDKMTEMDTLAGRILAQLEEDGLAEDTIVFYYGDHGPGMPRCKRWPYNSGLHVPMIVYFPQKFRDLAPSEYLEGGRSRRLISFVDLAPTVLSLAGVKPPDYVQGKAFSGAFCSPEQPYLYGFRGRMDERYDLVRSVRDQRYVYLRHFMPHKIYGQHLDYMFQTPTTRVWRELFDQGKTTSAQSAFWKVKPVEELYDLQNDPDEVQNLAALPEHQETLQRLRKAQRDLALEIYDIGFLPEDEIHRRSGSDAPYTMGRDRERYPSSAVLEMAELASSLDPAAVRVLLEAFGHADGAVRYWGAQGILMRGAETVRAASAELRQRLESDSAPSVRIACALALGLHGAPRDLENVLGTLVDLSDMQKHGLYVALQALNAVADLGARAMPAHEALKALPRAAPGVPDRVSEYVPRILEKIVSDLRPALIGPSSPAA